MEGRWVCGKDRRVSGGSSGGGGGGSKLQRAGWCVQDSNASALLRFFSVHKTNAWSPKVFLLPVFRSAIEF
jgi:hypothetical protein